MGPVETKMLEYLKRRLAEGALAVPADEIMNTVVSPAHPEHRLLPAYRRGLDRLLVRHVINATDGPDGRRHYFIGDYPSDELRKSLTDVAAPPATKP